MNTWSEVLGGRARWQTLPLVLSVLLSASCGRSEVPQPPASAGGQATPSSTPAATPDTTKPGPPSAAAPKPAQPAPKPNGPKPTTPVAAVPAAKPPTTSPVDTGETPTTAPDPAHDPYHPAPKDTVSEETYLGWKQFELNCARCHGEFGVGSSFAPALIVSLKDNGTIPTKELFVTTVCQGRAEKGMPSWCAAGLEMDKIQDIYLYLKGRADGKIGLGRPAVRGGG